METLGLFFGSSTGATARVAHQIQADLRDHYKWEAELLDVAEYYLEEMLAFDHLILGIPTWNHGQLQTDWELVFEELDTLNLAGKKIALFGLGDQFGYPDTFGDALFFLADKVRAQGAILVGRWPTTGYTFRKSWAVEAEQFLGLMLDEDNQPALTQPRLDAWLEIVAREMLNVK